MNAIARQLGITHPAALAIARTLMPGLLERLRNFPGGMDALLEISGKHGGEQLAAKMMAQSPVSTLAGETIIALMGGIALGSEDVSDDDAALRLKMAPLLVMLIVGYLWARAATGNLTQTEIANLLEFDDLPNSPGPEAV